MCAIHGLNGNGFDTWAANKMWLRDMLPTTEPFATSRIMTFGYQSGLDDRETTSGIRHWAIALLTQLSIIRASAQVCPRRAWDVRHPRRLMTTRRRRGRFYSSVIPSAVWSHVRYTPYLYPFYTHPDTNPYWQRGSRLTLDRQ